jgi:hypothetical protein
MATLRLCYASQAIRKRCKLWVETLWFLLVPFPSSCISVHPGRDHMGVRKENKRPGPHYTPARRQNSRDGGPGGISVCKRLRETVLGAASGLTSYSSSLVYLSSSLLSVKNSVPQSKFEILYLQNRKTECIVVNNWLFVHFYGNWCTEKFVSSPGVLSLIILLV